jgi:hypothetical protein
MINYDYILRPNFTELFLIIQPYKIYFEEKLDELEN